MEEEIWPFFFFFKQSYKKYQFNTKVTLRVMCVSNNTFMCVSDEAWNNEQRNDTA